MPSGDTGFFASSVRWFWRLFWPLLIALLLWSAWLDHRVRTEFDGKRWSLPARVFARSLELYPGLRLTPEQLVAELRMQRYRQNPELRQPGEYYRSERRVMFHARAFQFAHRGEQAERIEVVFEGDRVTAVRQLATQEDYDLWALAPLLIANIYPQHNEDRVLLKLDDVPPLLIEGLVAVEDRDFYQHWGLNPKSLLRALLANLKAGAAVQGGSTITQQLAKNFFLTQERNLWRKANEAIIAVLLELRYSKDDILEAYLNEIYLGQSGQQAVHGFGLASQFYFQKELETLSDEEIALLITLVRGASWYDPRRNPERARERRNHVLGVMQQQGVLSEARASQAQQNPLSVAKSRPAAASPFPGFMGVVREQLRRDYSEDSLRNEGLFIFTTLDPLAQQAAEQAVTEVLPRIERQRGLASGGAQVALVAANVHTAEILAVVGDSNPRISGFNRALNARRPIGSLVKPAVYLSALEDGRMALNTVLVDEPIAVPLHDGTQWTPQNYDKEFRGNVLMQQALMDSLNVPTAVVGLQTGLRAVSEHIKELAAVEKVLEVPALLLGAVEMTPMEVTQMYHSLAAGGERSTLRAIREVMDQQGNVLTRYPLYLKRVADEDATYLVNMSLHEVAKQGTAKRLNVLQQRVGPLAGKTGTTNDARDSWFAGFSASHVATVWVGRDDNEPLGLTGSSGALRIWEAFTEDFGYEPLEPDKPDNVTWYLIDRQTGAWVKDSCASARWMPFIVGTEPGEYGRCTESKSVVDRVLDWFGGDE